MSNLLRNWLLPLLLACASLAHAETAQQVVDIGTRPGITQRMLVLAPAQPKAAVILLAGGHGGLQLGADGTPGWGQGNFLVRARQLFADQGFFVVVPDAPSDRQSPPYLSGFRQQPEHAADIAETIAWTRRQAAVPVWLVGTSRGTQSAAYAATTLSTPAGPDGLVLSSTILTDNKSRPVPAMPLGALAMPVLVVHHEQDGCKLCAYSDMPRLMDALPPAPRTQLLTFRGGINRGDPCNAQAYHGYNGLDAEVVAQTAKWILAH